MPSELLYSLSAVGETGVLLMYHCRRATGRHPWRLQLRLSLSPGEAEAGGLGRMAGPEGMAARGFISGLQSQVRLTYYGEDLRPRDGVEVGTLVADLAAEDAPAVQSDRVEPDLAGAAAQFLTRDTQPGSDSGSPHVHTDALHSEHLHLVLQGGHEPEELLPVLVPLDGVQSGLLQVVVTTQQG